MKPASDDETQDIHGASQDTVPPVASGIATTAHQRAAEGQLRLPGRYDDDGAIAGGSFGEVRRVIDTVLERTVAMKLLHPEHATSSHLRRRFLAEAQITAQLQHPGIVSLYDRGELDDGRLWFTMKEIRGRTLRDVIDELHSVSGPEGFGTTPSGWTFRRVIDAYVRITQAVAYAHNRGVVHRDLKPENLMVGEFGEVLVMDWGLARRVSDIAATAADDPHTADAMADDPALTRHGDILGTPAYMPPEQARGETALHGPHSDVYSLGAVLYCLLSGQSPFAGHDSSGEVIAALMMGPPIAVTEAARGGPPLPAELCAVCERAMQRKIEDRYEDAAALAEDVVAWLDGVRRRQQALDALQQAQSSEPEIARLRIAAETAEAHARSIQSELRAFDSIDKKRPAWEHEDEAARLGREAALAETQWLEAVHGSLSIDPELPEAHALLADHYRGRLIDAEREHREQDAARAEALLRIHDRGRHAAFLRGDGRLTLITDPPGAEVVAERFVSQDRQLVPAETRVLGQTPLTEAPLQRGSYLLRIRAPGRTEVRYPVLIERDGHWDGCAPGMDKPFPIALPEQGALGPDDIYVPAGYSWIGGDREAADSLPRRRIWIDAFVIRRFPVTAGEYLDFLNDLVAKGREAEAIAACPRAHQALSEAGAEPAFHRDAQGAFTLPADREGLSWGLDWPMVLVDWHCAVAYARWLAEKTSRPWRLPDELEWEKAARGVDGRIMPWGDHVDPTFANGVDTSMAAAARRSIHSHPIDDSPYGVRGLAGNVRDWCVNVWRHEGPRVEQQRLVIEPAAADDSDFRTIKGGCWANPLTQGRNAARFGGRPAIRRPVLGFRVVFSNGSQ